MAGPFTARDVELCPIARAGTSRTTASPSRSAARAGKRRKAGGESRSARDIQDSVPGAAHQFKPPAGRRLTRRAPSSRAAAALELEPAPARTGGVAADAARRAGGRRGDAPLAAERHEPGKDQQREEAAAHGVKEVVQRVED